MITAAIAGALVGGLVAGGVAVAASGSNVRAASSPGPPNALSKIRMSWLSDLLLLITITALIP